MNIIRETFSKSERLCSKKILDELFEKGNIIHTSLLKVVWLQTALPSDCPAQIAISVPKKGFRLAVIRNLVKRRLREAYRRNRKPLYEALIKQNITIAFIVIVKGNTVPRYDEIEKAVAEIINRLTKTVLSLKG